MSETPQIDVYLDCGHVLRGVPLYPPYRKSGRSLQGPEQESCPYEGGRSVKLRTVERLRWSLSNESKTTKEQRA